jgi:hypothetical protein
VDNPEGSPILEVSLRSLAVNLIGFESNSQFVNPLTLYSNGIVDETWVCENGAQIGLLRSSFSYTNGVHVEAFDETISFRQIGTSISPSAALSTKLARKYIAAFNISDWHAVSVEFEAMAELSGESAADPSLSWPPFIDDLVFRDAQPRFGTNVFYYHPDRRLRIEIGRSPNSNSLSWLAWVYRPLDSDQSQAESQLKAALEDCQSDWEDVVNVASRLLAATIALGGS